MSDHTHTHTHTSAQIMVYVALDTPYRVAVRESILKLLMPVDFAPIDGENAYYVYRVRETVLSIRLQIYNFFHINDVSVDRFSKSASTDNNGK
jgi:hypothetical protein